jgi:4-hydroxybenzoate polyprenyltransferase
MLIKLKAYLQLIRFNKPIGTLLLLWPTLWALLVAANGIPSLQLIVVFSTGVFLTRSAGCVINDYLDKNFDKHVARTKNRPLVNDLISSTEAISIFFAISLSAFILSLYYLKYNTLLLSVPAFFIFVTYPFMKRFFFLPQVYLGIAFSFGILMAFMEIRNQLNNLAWIMFGANFLWVLGYDTVYALIDIDDDLLIGIKTSAITLGKFVVKFIVMCYILFLALMVLLGVKLSMHYPYWLSLTIAAMLIAYQVIILSKNQKVLYFKIFLLNNWVGLFVCIGIILQCFI